jgi:Apea-like HEPN
LGPACDYEEAVLKSLLVYGRACYQADPVDKLLQIITAFEMLTLRDDNEPIMGAVGERLAFVVATGVEERQSVVTNFKRVYGVRSKRTHHGHTIEETQDIEAFLENVLKFFHQAILRIGRHKTKADFLGDLDRLKFT